MRNNPNYKQAQEILLENVHAVGTERVALSECGGRILAEHVTAEENVPAFDRSPYDGYAFCSADTENASKETPVTLKILEEIPAGAFPTKQIVSGTAAKVLTGAPIPEGADAVIMYEKTEFTEEHVTIFSPVSAGANIVRTGEDIKKGAVLAEKGMGIDAGLSATLAAQGIAVPLVYKRPRIALLSTGSELVEAECVPDRGKIRNTNRYMFETVLRQYGCETMYLGIAGDSEEEISELILRGLAECDAVVMTGGVSVGDYDLTPAAMERAGVELLFRGVDMKPGMACAYGVKDGKMVCGLSGNPASSLVNFYAAALPMLKKLAGWKEYRTEEIQVTLLGDFKKKSPKDRFLRGKLRFLDGTAVMDFPKEQGNVVISSSIGCDMMAVIPAGSGAVPAGSVLKGFLL